MNTERNAMLQGTKPYLRWWWFSGPLERDAIDEQLEWIAEKGFGGVELAWVYPLPHAGAEDGPRFLDAEWQSCVGHAREKCRELGLGCDLTFGTLWPFGGTFVPPEFSSKTLAGLSAQRLTRSWESRYSEAPGLILDHLDEQAFSFYADHLLDHGFRDLSRGMKPSFFCDSWEVEAEGGLAYASLFQDFLERFGYDLRPHAANLDANADIRFDYRLAISDRILDQFYAPYSRMCSEAGASSRVQCHGSPTDILAAYAMADIPESETLLFDPDFALIAASAAAIWDKPVVSSESFTCIYGWVPKPGTPPGLGRERIEDLRCVADAQFAWGVNRVVWHGKPYSTKDQPNRFYATVHVGPDGDLDPSLPSFNRYLGETSRYLGIGRTYSRMAVYFPLEDQWMLGALPEELEKPSSHYYWELQELHIPDELLPWRPLWFSGKWLKDLHFDGKSLSCGSQTFEVFISDARWMLLEHLERLCELAEQGAPIIFRNLPEEPGFIKHARYAHLLETIGARAQMTLDSLTPVLSSDQPLDFWCRRDGNDYYLFISHPKMRKLRYPCPAGTTSGSRQLLSALCSIRPCVITGLSSPSRSPGACCAGFGMIRGRWISSIPIPEAPLRPGADLILHFRRRGLRGTCKTGANILRIARSSASTKLKR